MLQTHLAAIHCCQRSRGPHAFTVALHDHAVAVMLDLVDPLFEFGTLLAGADARVDSTGRFIANKKVA
jgi:hypothetical protein